jgi:RNA polymerase sigma factor (sigma-70 family)
MRANKVKMVDSTPQIEMPEQVESQVRDMPERFRQRFRLGDNPLVREMGRHEPLAPEEEMWLRRQYEPGQPHSAREKLVLANLQLVVTIARHYRRRGLCWDDLLQEGVCGLIRAADRFNPNRGSKFRAYASWRIMKSIAWALDEQTQMVRDPSYLGRTFRTFREFRKRFLPGSGVGPAHRDLHAHFKLSERGIRALLRPDVSWHGAKKISDHLPCHRTASPDQRMINEERQDVVRRALTDRLDHRVREIICRRFGLGDVIPETLEQIGKSMSLTRERVRQLELQGLETLKRLGRVTKLEDQAYR